MSADTDKPVNQHTNIVKAFLSEIEAGEFEKAESRLATNFAFSSMKTLPSINKPKYLVQMQSTKRAFPDWAFNASRFEEHGDTVTTTLRITGTHKNDLETFIRSVPIVKATGKTIEVPPTPMEVRLRDGKIETMYVHSDPGGCVECVFKLLDVELPRGWQKEAEIPV